ncbi:MAG TPA: PRC-barrel domain-containing protein [Verrucomicrobiae bacterium]|nr:PRC-barrel domain-containing protein [Verrucomicrobiae bacterium]
MKYASKIIGQPVVSYDTGERFQDVNDLIYDDQRNVVLALLVDEGGWFGQAKVVRFEDLKSIGDDAIIVPSQSVVIQADSDPVVSEAVNKKHAVKGKQILTEEGKDLGKIADLCIEEVSGRVEGYLVTGGIFADVYKGQPFVPAPEVIKVGDDVLFVPNETEQLVREQNGGIKGAAQEAGDKAAELKDSVAEKGQSLAATVKEKAEEGRQSLTGTYENAKESVTSPETKEKVGEAKDALGTMWDQVKEKAGELKDQAESKVEEGKIKAALGKPTNRVIFDTHDEVILNTGDLITNEAVDRARQAGVLDVLLSSVYDKEPDLKQEDLRVQQPSE